MGLFKQRRLEATQLMILFSCLDGTENTVAVASVIGSSSPSVGAVVGAALGGCLLGAALAVLAIGYAVRRRRPRIPSSPHYLSAKQQNHYVSMGSLDWKKGSGVVIDDATIASLKPMVAPQPPSSASTANGLPHVGHKINNIDYPTATIKRNSHITNGREIRANIEADNIF